MKISPHAGGRLNLERKQQLWFGDEPLLQRALYAGQEVIAITDDAGAFDLMYLGFEAKGFLTMDLA